MKALRKVYDPEIPVNLVDLGLIYDVQIDGEDVAITMTLTAIGCPMHSVIAKNVQVATEAVEGVRAARVLVTWDPRWTPDLISAEGRVALGMA